MKKQKGIDVSKYQGTIDWSQVKKDNIAFAIVRAGYGKLASQKDPMFEQNDKACRSLKIPLGVYWYSYAKTPEEAQQEAKACLAVIQQRHYPLAVWYDVEDASQNALSKETVTKIAQRFCQAITEAGHQAGIYSYQSFLESHLTEEIRKKYPVWVAHTGVTEPAYSLPYHMWQYSHAGSVKGIRGKVDMNYWYGEFPSKTPSQPPSQPAVAPATPAELAVYTVKKGDTLSSVARAHGVTVQQLVAENGIQNPDLIVVGQKLRIPAKKQERVYVVKENDTLTGIAGKFGTTVAALVQKNGIANPDLIVVGQRLKI